MKKIIAITLGDPLGIGPEITVKALKSKKLQSSFIPIVIGEYETLKKAGWNSSLSHFINTAHQKLDLKTRKPNKTAGLISFKAVKTAVKLALAKKADAIVTAPISKEAWQMAQIKYTGHTDFFRKNLNSHPLMAFIHGNIRAALLTEHVSLKTVPSKIDKETIIQKAELFNKALRTLGIKKPKICACSLNPHSGDNGLMGNEEIKTISPAITALKQKKVDIHGPYPTDQAWLEHINGRFDGILANYHDQALTPLKIIAKGHNFTHWTYGLDFIRTSPAHGTAFDIAGQKKAGHLGMLAAILFALKLVRRQGN
ncbi:MAG: 4-hydroxythreonine-4-phosphate dehydrogenase PdxA [Elusimicrobia bacterium]|nr:4-hydroxythreonine-4-phosphate dehydrogenase PdxA [Elusimicrobiota bacterium]